MYTSLQVLFHVKLIITQVNIRIQKEFLQDENERRDGSFSSIFIASHIYIWYYKIGQLFSERRTIMKLNRKLFAMIMITAICFSFVTLLFNNEARAASIKLNKKTVYMSKGKTTTLKVKGTTAKVKWKSSDSSVVKVSKKGKLTAKNYGTATITAKVKKKTLKCKVKVERKGEKNARILRDYILKNGTKSGSTRYISKKVYDGDDSEGTTYIYSITASSKNNILTFEYSTSTTEPPAYRKVTMKIDLIGGSGAVKTGTTELYHEDGYGIDTWERYYADITTKFTHTYDSTGTDTASGITITKYVENEDETQTETTDPAVLNQEKYLRPTCVNTTWAFSYWDKLIASKKALKKEKITMKTLGFTKVSY
jgi:hypothetical protein